MKTAKRITIERMVKFHKRWPRISTWSLLEYFGIGYHSLKRYEQVTQCKPLPRGRQRITFPNFIRNLARDHEFDKLDLFLKDYKETKRIIDKNLCMMRKIQGLLGELAKASKLIPVRRVGDIEIRVDPEDAAKLWKHDLYVHDCGYPVFLENDEVERVFHSMLIPGDQYVAFFKSVGYDCRKANMELAPVSQVHYQNVSWVKKEKVFEAYGSLNCRKVHLGKTKDPELADHLSKQFAQQKENNA
ncbi:hypothetical protein AHIS2_p038 [Acaryochloris phage A-HIS2]|nr:hypothetical protein AHIS2_p038 [Acaryochloris phage A-HIS2]